MGDGIAGRTEISLSSGAWEGGHGRRDDFLHPPIGAAGTLIIASPPAKPFVCIEKLTKARSIIL